MHSAPSGPVGWLARVRAAAEWAGTPWLVLLEVRPHTMHTADG